MAAERNRALHVVSLGVDLDRDGRAPQDLLPIWRDFARLEAAASDGASLRVTIVQAAWREERRRVEGIDCHFVRESDPALRIGRKFLQRAPLRLCARVRDLAPDVVAFSGLTFPRQLRALRRALPQVPIVAQDHAMKAPRGWRRWYYRWGLQAIDAAMFCARDQADALKAIGVLPPRLPIFEVIETSSPFQPGDRRAARAATGLDGDPCLFWLGNLTPNKDPLMVLDAVARASASLPDLRFFMCFREGQLRPAVEARISGDERLRARVRLLGEIPFPGTETYLRAADFLLQGSHEEGGGWGPIEALACGATPIVTDIPSFRSITRASVAEDRAHGVLVPVGDAAAMAAAIVRLGSRLGDGDRADRRRAARQHFDQTLSFAAIGATMREAFRRAAALR